MKVAMCKKTIYIIILVSTLYSQSYFNRIFGSDIQYGDARSMALAGTYVTTGTSSSVISRNPARLSYISDGEKGYSIDFQINSRINSERRSIDILDSFGDFLAETDYVSNQSSNFYGSFGFIASDKNPKKGQVGGGASITTLASFDYMYEEEVRYEQSFDDGQSGSRDPLLGFNKYGSKGYSIWTYDPVPQDVIEKSYFPYLDGSKCGYYSFSLAYDLGSLRHLEKYGVKLV